MTSSLELLSDPRLDLSAADYFLKARCAEQLGEAEAALRSYHLALQMAADRHDWRWLYAKLLHREGRLTDALRELLILKQARPSKEVDEEYETVERERAIQ